MIVDIAITAAATVAAVVGLVGLGAAFAWVVSDENRLWPFVFILLACGLFVVFVGMWNLTEPIR